MPTPEEILKNLQPEVPQEEQEVREPRKPSNEAWWNKVLNVVSMPGELGSLGVRLLINPNSYDTKQLSWQTKEAFKSGNLWSNLRETQEIQRKRPGLFWGEKFLTEMIADPFNYVGFGLMGKLPLAGKLLGPMEQAYIRAINKATLFGIGTTKKVVSGLTFDQIAKLSSKGIDDLLDKGVITPQTRDLIAQPQTIVYKTSKIRDVHQAAFSAYMDNITGYASRNIDDPSITKQSLDALMKTPYNDLDDYGRIVFDALSTDNLTTTRLNSLKWVQKLAEKTGRTYGKAEVLELNNYLNRFLRNEYGFDYTLDSILFTLNKTSLVDDAIRDRATLWLKGFANKRERYIKSLSNMTPARAIDALGSHASSQAAKEIKDGISLLRAQQGLVGGILNSIDSIYTRIWRNSIEKWMMRPFSAWVLSHPTYAPMNILEDIIDIFLGGARPRVLSAEELNYVLQGVGDPSLEILRRTDRFGPAEAAQLLGVRSKETPLMPPAGRYSRFFGRYWTDLSNSITGGLRRGFFVDRLQENYITQLNKTDIGRTLLDHINKLPSGLPEKQAELLKSRALLLAGSGQFEALGKLASEFTGPELQKDLAKNILTKFPELYPRTRQLIRSAIRTGNLQRVKNSYGGALKLEYEALTSSKDYIQETIDTIINTLRNNPPKTPQDLGEMMMSVLRQVDEGLQVAHSQLEAAHTIVLNDKLEGAAAAAVFDNAYKLIEEFSAILDTGTRSILREYEIAASSLGINVKHSRDGLLKLFSIHDEAWAQDKILRADHFASGGSVREWQVIRAQHWAPYNQNIRQASVEAQLGILADLQSVGGLGLKFDDLLQKYQSAPQAMLTVPPGGLSNLWATRKTQLDKLYEELNNTFSKPVANPTVAKAISDWTLPVEQLARNKSLRPQFDKALKETQDQTKIAFTDYEDQYSLDFVMKHIYPFWNYQSQILPRLAAMGITHPVAWKLMGPEGAYWSNTDNGYLSPTLWGVQIAPYRGLGVGRLRRIFQKEFPPRQEGVAGEIEKFNDKLERWGFYPGWPWQAGSSALTAAFTDQRWEWGADLPPLWETAVHTAITAGTLADLPGVENLPEALQLGRFFDADLRESAFQLGLNPDKMTPEQERDALTYLSRTRAIGGLVNLLRFRPEKVQEYRKAYNEALSLITNTPVEEIERLRDNGISFLEQRPLDPFERQKLRKILGQQFGDIYRDYMSLNEPFLSLEEQARRQKIGRLMDKYDNLRVVQGIEQLKDDTRLLNNTPGFTARIWRDNISNRGKERANLFRHAREILGLSEKDVEGNKAISTLDRIIDAYYAVDAENYRDPLTGILRQDQLEQARMRVLQAIIAELPVNQKELMLQKFREFQYQNMTPLEQKFKKGSALGYYDWFNTEKAVQWFSGADKNTLKMLQDLNFQMETGDQVFRLSIMQGDPVGLANLKARTPGEQLMKTVVQSYRMWLLENRSGLSEWLRTFYPEMVTRFTP